MGQLNFLFDSSFQRNTCYNLFAKLIAIGVLNLNTDVLIEILVVVDVIYSLILILNILIVLHCDSWDTRCSQSSSIDVSKSSLAYSHAIL